MHLNKYYNEIIFLSYLILLKIVCYSLICFYYIKSIEYWLLKFGTWIILKLSVTTKMLNLLVFTLEWIDFQVNLQLYIISLCIFSSLIFSIVFILKNTKYIYFIKKLFYQIIYIILFNILKLYLILQLVLPSMFIFFFNIEQTQNMFFTLSAVIELIKILFYYNIFETLYILFYFNYIKKNNSNSNIAFIISLFLIILFIYLSFNIYLVFYFLLTIFFLFILQDFLKFIFNGI